MLKTWLERLLPSRRAAAAPAAGNDEDPAVLEHLREYIEGQVAGGFMPAAEIAGAAIESFEGEIAPERLAREAPRLTAEALARHAAEQATWPAVTDCDRLDAAFAALEAQGVVARQDFSCCNTCGSAEIGAEMDDMRAAGRMPRGYAFYHMQDTESAAQGYGVYLSYGAANGADADGLAIGREIAERLTAHGLTVNWDGRINKRIGVDLDWKRRRTDHAAFRA